MIDEWIRSALLLDVQKHQPKKLTDSLPGAFTSDSLRWLRSSACRHTDPLLNCAKWRQRERSDPSDSCWENELADERPELVTSEYVCSDCTHPVVPIRELMEKLFDKSDNDRHDEKTWRRYVNEESPMKPDIFRQIMVNAWSLGWQGKSQTFSIWLQINELQAAKGSLKTILARAKERISFRTTGQLTVMEDELEKEFLVQRSKLTEKGFARFEQRQRSWPTLDLPAKLLAWIRKM